MLSRNVEPEWLDHLPSSDPRAIASRADLRRINQLMGHASIISRSFFQHHASQTAQKQPLRIADLGGGDGTLLLSLARKLRAQNVLAEVDLLDARPAVSPQTAAAFCQLGWPIHTKTVDALQWARMQNSNQEPLPRYDLIVCTLFLHHFKNEPLRELLAGIAASTTLFIACEPRRSGLSLWAARALRLIRCTAVTLHDAKVSVQAGFTGKELSRLWRQPPRGTSWHLVEGRALFSHSFIATHR